MKITVIKKSSTRPKPFSTCPFFVDAPLSAPAQK
jgi:hypothetical protein